MGANAKPTFFVIGAPKCGTSSLCHYLASHPNVFFSVPKEPAYWCIEDELILRKTGVKTRDAYLRLFAGARAQHVAVGEGSTCYLSSEHAVARINDFNRAARFIIMLRDPVEMVHALHRENLFNFDEDIEDFEQAWGAQAQRRRGQLVPRGCCAPRFLQYGDMGKYALQVERCLSTVGNDRLLMVFFDDFVRETGATYRAVLDFLGLPDDGRTTFPRLREAQAHRWKSIGTMMLKPPKPLATPVALIRRAAERNESGIAGIMSRWFRVRQRREPLRAEFEDELRRYFRPDVERLASILRRNLSHWMEKR